MSNDYRNTKYCSELVNLHDKKKDVEKCVLSEHKTSNIYSFVRNNKLKYKQMFADAYNRKCAYCGISTDIESLDSFEIDHFIHEKNRIFKYEKDASYMENLVFSCHECNSNKKAFDVINEKCENLHPDDNYLKSVYYRNDDYRITIKENVNSQGEIRFYEKMKLGSDLRRIDYLLMNLLGFYNNANLNTDIREKISRIILILITKRNNGHYSDCY